MTEHELQAKGSDIKHYEGLLTVRYPDISDPTSPLGQLVVSFGTEIVLRILDARDGFDTPLPEPNAD